MLNVFAELSSILVVCKAILTPNFEFSEEFRDRRGGGARVWKVGSRGLKTLICGLLNISTTCVLSADEDLFKFPTPLYLAVASSSIKTIALVSSS